MYRIIAGILVAIASAQAQAQTNSAPFVSVNVPTLDDVGLVVLTLIVAIAGGFAVRRRKK